MEGNRKSEMRHQNKKRGIKGKKERGREKSCWRRVVPKFTFQKVTDGEDRVRGGGDILYQDTKIVDNVQVIKATRCDTSTSNVGYPG